jgi:hypothetical protein
MKKIIIFGMFLMLCSLSLNASDMTYGEMAGIIRSADYPCARVLELEQTGNNTWIVKCNAGSYSVGKLADGHYAVDEIKPDQDGG